MSEAITIREGCPAPDFVAEGPEGMVRLSDLLGQWVVLYFYPKDDTPGCTREACGFRDAMTRLQELGATVVGISRDRRSSHDRFAAKHGLKFRLLSDPDASIHRAYGAWGEKRSYGKVSEGVIRSTFLLDERGVIRKVWRNVKVDGHVDEVIAGLQRFRSVGRTRAD